MDLKWSSWSLIEALFREFSRGIEENLNED